MYLWQEISASVKNIKKAINNPINKSVNNQYKELKTIFEKSLAVNKNLPKGHFITFNDLEAKKPKGYGIDAALFRNVLGKKIKSNKNQWDFLNEVDLE